VKKVIPIPMKPSPKLVAIILSLISHLMAFWAGGAFAFAVTIIDCTGGLTPEGLMQALAWPVSYFQWLLQ